MSVALGLPFGVPRNDRSRSCIATFGRSSSASSRAQSADGRFELQGVRRGKRCGHRDGAIQIKRDLYEGPSVLVGQDKLSHSSAGPALGRRSRSAPTTGRSKSPVATPIRSRTSALTPKTCAS